MNVLVFFLSKIGIAPKSITYSADGRSFVGIQTNEAAAKYLISRLKDSGETLDKIIAVTSREASGDALRLFSEGFDSFCGNGFEKPELVTISSFSGEQELADDIVLASVMDNIGLEDTVYLDVSGGRRTDANMMLLLMIWLSTKVSPLPMCFIAVLIPQPPAQSPATAIFTVISIFSTE